MNKQVLSVLFLSVPAWHCMLSVQEENDLERVLRTALHIILGTMYVSFSNALSVTNQMTLKSRRNKIVRNFVRKSVNHEKFKNLFHLYENYGRDTRSIKPLFTPVPARTQSYRRSPIPTLTDIANKLPLHTWK